MPTRRRQIPALCLFWAWALAAGAVRAQDAPPAGDVPERLSRIEQAMWSREGGALSFLRDWAVADPNDRVRERSIGALALLGDSGARAIFLDRLARDPSGRVRRAAAEAIGVLALPVRESDVGGPLANDGDPLVRAECARALGRSGTRDAAGALVARVAIDPSPEVRALSAEALGRLRLPSALAVLGQAAGGDRSTLVQTYAIRAILEIDPESCAPLFEELMNSVRDVDVRFELYRGLLRSRAAAQWSLSGMSDSDDRVRFLALQEWSRRITLPRSGRLDRRSEPVLKLATFLADPAPGIRELAKATLEKFGFRVRPYGLVFTIDD